MKKLLLFAASLIMGFSLLTLSTPVFADNCVDTAFFGQQCDENGDTIFMILNYVVDVMTIGIGVLGVIGITIVGIQYLTAGGNEEKTRKAKRRMFEIIMGLVAYVVIYALIRWLMPNFQGIGTGATAQTNATISSQTYEIQSKPNHLINKII
ncbi:hypothetical protein IKD49_00885 [Candidatus Saccharibacteria bacterium]|nr:hypothetical protein [Candidatus Saccharibacteria bacterium]